MGHVRWQVYRSYAAATGWWWVALIFTSLALMQASDSRPDARWGWALLLPTKPPYTLLLYACVCVSILQATRNGNDLWLSHWVSQAPPPPAGSSSSLAATAAAALWRSSGVDSGTPQRLPAPLPAMLGGCTALGCADGPHGARV